MRRLNLGITLLSLVAAVLVIAPTAVFGYLWGPGAVMFHWIWVALLVGLMFLGIMLVFSGRPSAGRPNPAAPESRLRLRLGLGAFGLVAAILVFAPIFAFGSIFGFLAVLAHFAAVIVLGAMTFGGLYLIFTDKRFLVAKR
jgi:hypothetical protein